MSRGPDRGRSRRTTSHAHGLVLFDKPAGITSFDVVARARRLYSTREVGHAGTLDPLATGLLPVLVGEGTKLAPYLVGLDKEYVTTVRLGVETDTYDAEGRVVAEASAAAVAAIAEGRVREAIARFVGPIAQRPPAYSAIKRDGRKLYELARAGEAVEGAPRAVVIHAIDLLAFGGGALELCVRCGKGTYIRSLAHDLGEALGVGGHVAALRRTRVGPFSVDEAAALDASPRDPIPLARALGHLPFVTVDAEGERRLRMGQQQQLQALAAPPGTTPVRVLDGEGRLVAMAERDAAARLQLSRVFRAAGELADAAD